MPLPDAVKRACESCRARKRKCIPTSGAKCERCVEKNLFCVISPPTEEQGKGQWNSTTRHSDQSKILVDSISEASFDSLFDESGSKSESNADHSFAHVLEGNPQQVNHSNSTIVVDRQSTATAMRTQPAERFVVSPIAHTGYRSHAFDKLSPGKKKTQTVTSPSQTTSNPTTPQRTPVSPAPLAKMISTKRDLPELSIPQRENDIRTLQRQRGGTSRIFGSAIKAESATSDQARRRSPSSATLTAPPLKRSQYQLDNTTMKVYLSGSKGYRPLLLKDCMVSSRLFTKIIETWSLPDDSVDRLHVTFPWLRTDNNGRLMILDRRHLKAGLVCICNEVQEAPCWDDEGGSCSVEVTVFRNTRTTGPTTGDGRPIPDMSVNANRVYWAMRANQPAADVGLHVQRIATELGMDRTDVVAAGDELLEHCLISTSENDYDVFSLLES